MSDNWTMPDWLRDALLACGYCQESIGEADSLYDTDKQEIRLSAISGNDILDIANSIDDLIPLRAAGLLLTPGERADAQITENSLEQLHVLYDKVAAEITRLRAENERLKKLLDELRRWCGCGYAEDGLFNRIDTALGAEHE